MKALPTFGCGGELQQEDGKWHVQFTREGLRQFTVQTLFHEVGHHIDCYYRRWSKANGKACEDWADQYAMSFSREGTEVLDRLEQQA